MKTFEEALTVFKSATSTSMEAARACAAYAIVHFKEHGDLSQAQSFLDAMPKNYVRRSAFLKWLHAHSPVLVEKNHLSKDKVRAERDGEKAWNVAAALATPFWDFAPDREEFVYTGDDIITVLQRALKRFTNDHSKPKDEAAKAQLAAAQRAIGALKPVAA